MLTNVFAQVDDAGVQIIVQLVDQSGAIINIAAATGLTIKLGYPDGTASDKTATLYTDGTDGKIVYTTSSSDLTQIGFYKVQGKVTLGGQPVSTRVGYLQVFQNVDNT